MDFVKTLSFPEAIQLAVSRFFEFEGRSRRSEYWWVILALLVLSAIIPIVASVFDLIVAPLTFRRLHDTGRSGWWYGLYLILQYLAIVGLFIYMGFGLLAFDDPFGMVMSVLSAGLGWVSLIVLYRVVLLVFLCQDSCPTENKYGPSPKYVQEQE